MSNSHQDNCFCCKLPLMSKRETRCDFRYHHLTLVYTHRFTQFTVKVKIPYHSMLKLYPCPYLGPVFACASPFEEKSYSYLDPLVHFRKGDILRECGAIHQHLRQAAAQIKVLVLISTFAVSLIVQIQKWNSTILTGHSAYHKKCINAPHSKQAIYHCHSDPHILNICMPHCL